jgi:hypothetical protein
MGELTWVRSSAPAPSPPPSSNPTTPPNQPATRSNHPTHRRSLANVIFGGAATPVQKGRVEACDVATQQCHQEVDVASGWSGGGGGGGGGGPGGGGPGWPRPKTQTRRFSRP